MRPLLYINLNKIGRLQVEGLQAAFKKTANGLELFGNGLSQIRVFCIGFEGRIHQQTPTLKRIVQCAIQHFCEEPGYGHSSVWQRFKAPNSITHTALQIVHEGATIKTTFVAKRVVKAWLIEPCAIDQVSGRGTLIALCPERFSDCC
ncbi:hypothetical protein A7D21_29310 [Pseudomonas sp. AP19]|nr:hypothetical protein A7D21_29310 [Pseudomonas sp. AP19]